MKNNPIDDPKELIDAIEQSTRKDIAALIALSEYSQIDQKICEKMIKSHNFRLALIHKLNEEI